MRATAINHVSVRARRLAISVWFYTEIFGMERIPSPVFRMPTAWLRVGRQQLHLVESESPAPHLQHFALNVDDFEDIYAKALAMGVEDRDTWGSHVYELPDGAVQLYLRDPADNLVEVDWPDVTTLDASIAKDIPKLADEVHQTEAASGATLFLTR